MEPNSPEFIDKLANLLFNFTQVPSHQEKTDCLIVMGNYDTTVATRAAELYKQGIAPVVVATGGKGRSTPSNWENEATEFKKIMVSNGVPEDKILLEKESTNTSENVLNTKALLEKEDIKVETVTFVIIPPVEKRAYATFLLKWPEIKAYSPMQKISYIDYADKAIPKEEVINLCVGEISRYILYSKRGWMSPQPISLGAIDAYNRLVELGFTKYIEK